MSEVSGRVYHPADEKHGSIGLVRSKLSIEFSRFFEFDESQELSQAEYPAPVRFRWNGSVHQLERTWVRGLANEATLSRTDLK